MPLKTANSIITDDGDFFLNIGGTINTTTAATFLAKIDGAYGTGADVNDKFGYSVAVGSGRIVVGAYGDNDNVLFGSGSAYIFDLDGNFINKINGDHGTGAAASDYFGWSVAVGSGRVVVGAYGDDDNALSGSGSAYIFDLDGNFIKKIDGAYGTGPSTDDYFGYSVAVGSGRVVVGAYLDDDNGTSSGSAYIFDLDGNFIKKIDGTGGTGPSTDDYFGHSVAVGSGRIVVGAYGDDDNGSNSGSAYIFDLNGNFINKINGAYGTGAAANDIFGWAVAAGSGRIVVGAYGDDDNISSGSSSGSAYIFDLDGNFIKKIDGTGGTGAAGDDLFGRSVAVGSGRIVVGAYGDDDNALLGSGSAYIFDLDGNFINKINGTGGTGAAANDNFGWAVAAGSGRVVVGAYGDDDNGLDASGSAYIFDLDGNFINKIDGTGGTGANPADYFGWAVAAGSGRVVVGAYADDDNGLSASGSAYIFDLDGNFINKINGTGGTGAAALDFFGRSVAVGSGRIVVGAIQDDDNGLSQSGSAYIFDLDGNFINKINGAYGTGANADDYFGTSVAVGSGRIVVGAYLDDDNALTGSGSAYIFTTPLSNHVLDML